MEQKEFVEKMRNWVDKHAKPDEPFLFLDAVGKSFTPRELLGDIEEDTALGGMIFDIIMEKSEEMLVYPIGVLDHLGQKMPKVPFGGEKN